MTNELLTVDLLSTNNSPNVPVDSTIDRTFKLPSILTGANTAVCYPVVGCFDNNSPFDNAARELPQTPEHINTQFLLFTQETPTSPEFLSYDGNDQSIENWNLNSSRWLRIIVHGFQNNRNSIWIKPLQDELLKLRDVRHILHRLPFKFLTYSLSIC